MSILRSHAAPCAFAAATLTVVARAEATVTRVDGTILAVTTHMPTAIDAYALPAGTINAVKDAAEQPQIFRPRLTSPVVFLDMHEVAGFGRGCSTGGDGSLGAGLAMLGLLLARRRPRRTGARVLQVAAIVAMLGALLGGCKDEGNESSAYLVWQNVATRANNGSDVVFSRSSDGGATWSTPRVIDDPPERPGRTRSSTSTAAQVKPSSRRSSRRSAPASPRR
jgi:MYXO-CTERM domain-containing protein